MKKLTETAEINSDDFWKLFKSRKRQSCTAAGSEIKFEVLYIGTPNQ